MGEVKMRIFSGFALLAYASAAAVAPAANSQAAKPAGSAASAKGIVEKEVDKVMTKYPQHAGMAEMLTDLFESVVSADNIWSLEKRLGRKPGLRKPPLARRHGMLQKRKLAIWLVNLKRRGARDQRNPPTAKDLQVQRDLLAKVPKSALVNPPLAQETDQKADHLRRTDHHPKRNHHLEAGDPNSHHGEVA